MAGNKIYDLLARAIEAREVKSFGPLSLLLAAVAKFFDGTSALVTWGAADLGLVAAARYLPPGNSDASASSAPVVFLSPAAGRLKGLTYAAVTTGDPGVTITVQYLRNGAVVPGGPVLVLPGDSAGSGTQLGAVDLAYGDTVALQVTKDGPMAVSPTGVVCASSFVRPADD